MALSEAFQDLCPEKLQEKKSFKEKEATPAAVGVGVNIFGLE